MTCAVCGGTELSSDWAIRSLVPLLSVREVFSEPCSELGTSAESSDSQIKSSSSLGRSADLVAFGMLFELSAGLEHDLVDMDDA